MPSWYLCRSPTSPSEFAHGRPHAVGRDHQVRLEAAPVGELQDAFGPRADGLRAGHDLDAFAARPTQ